jgi:hypothetical protein
MKEILSFHDDYLAAYEVRCEAKEITLCIRSAQNNHITKVVFTGVEGYCLKNDAMGNIISSLERVPAQAVIDEFKNDIAESFRMAGAPGPWAVDLTTAVQYLTGRGAQGFMLSSSFGMSGWILASRVEAQQAVPGGSPRTARSIRA